MSRGTVTLAESRVGSPGSELVDCLVAVMDLAQPLVGPWRVGLGGVDEVILGRGDGGWTRQGRGLRVELGSPSVSSAHARLLRGPDGWTLVDEGSKNGSWVNGARAARRAVGGNDLVEIGTTCFLLRPGAGDLTREALAARPGGLRTLAAPLESSFALLERVAGAGVPLLLLGETGTGKEVVARAAHQLSGRPGPFQAVNCGALAENLIASELFGARKGAFSGAVADRPGLILEAHRGTLFLDEVAELSAPAQAALLRVLQEHELMPVGASRPVPVDVRLVAATNDDLRALVTMRKFRKDLHARIAGVTLTLPPLRERREDLGLLLAELLPRIAGKRASHLTLQRGAARAIFTHDWPENIRELEHALAAAVALAPADELRAEHFPTGGDGQPPSLLRDQFAAIVAEHHGNVSAIARSLQTSRAHVRRLADRHGVDLERLRGK